jgi:hypothetical protein
MERMSIITQRFFIAKAYHAAAFAALTGGETELMEEYQNLEGLMAASNWPVDVDADGNIISIRFDADTCSGIELRFFAALAPFVRVGSLILCLLDNTDPILWLFDGARVRQQTGAAFAKQLATILSRALASDCGPHTAVADRVQARLSAYRAVTATLAEDYHEMPDSYTQDEPESQADALYHSTDEEDAIVAHVRDLEQQVADLRQQLATPLYVVVEVKGSEIQRSGIAVFTSPESSAAGVTTRQRAHTALDDTASMEAIATDCVVDGYIVDVLTVQRPGMTAAHANVIPDTQITLHEQDDTFGEARLTVCVRANQHGVYAEVLDSAGREAASMGLDLIGGKPTVYGWPYGRTNGQDDPDTIVLVADLALLNRTDSSNPDTPAAQAGIA